MATAKFHEGTKFETSLDLEEGEGIIFVKPEKNRISRVIGMKAWIVNLVITDRRLVTIPMPKYQKKYAMESYYFKDMNGVKAEAQHDKSTEASFADFSVNMKQGGNSTYREGGRFQIMMVFSLLNLIKAFRADTAEAKAKYGTYDGFAEYAASGKTDSSRAYAEATGASHYTEYSPNYAKMRDAAKARVANMDFSREAHQKIRDYIVGVVNQCIEIANS